MKRIAALLALLFLFGCAGEEIKCISSGHVNFYRGELEWLSEAPSGSFVIFTEEGGKYVQFAGGFGDKSVLLDMPASQFSQDEESAFLNLADGEGLSVSNTTYGAGAREYSYQIIFSDMQKAAEFTHSVFQEVFGMNGDYRVCVSRG